MWHVTDKGFLKFMNSGRHVTRPCPCIKNQYPIIFNISKKYIIILTTTYAKMPFGLIILGGRRWASDGLHHRPHKQQVDKTRLEK